VGTPKKEQIGWNLRKEKKEGLRGSNWEKKGVWVVLKAKNNG